MLRRMLLLAALFWLAACAAPQPILPAAPVPFPTVTPTLTGSGPESLPLPTAAANETANATVTLTPTITLQADLPALLTPQPLVEIPLTGPATIGKPEFSGLAWYGDSLVLLPQYPERFGLGDGALFVLDRAEIEAFLDGASSAALSPRPLPVDAPGLRGAIPGFEGFESIVFDGDRLYLTAEASPPGGMRGWILAGQVLPELSGVTIDVSSAVSITPQADIRNMSDEAIVLVGSGDTAALLTIYEANGRLVNSRPVVHRFGPDLTAQGTQPFPPVEYRITDATPADERGRFWAINYFYPGDVKLKPGSDPLLRLLVRSLPQVERLVEFEIREDAVAFSGEPPVYLELLDADARNWEGIARLGERGFLLVTDHHPRTILAFVARPGD